ncbi:MAG: hypothetical protein HUU49_05015 [Candidatus Buchananbacteria bacterium]|nr:hypothetical protein [Candidatus Buchananbacteria bacterium]
MQQCLSLNGNGPSRVIVKFAFTNDKHIPNGIPVKKREADHVVDATHMVSAVQSGQTEEAQIGRHREGRVDTGTPVIQNLGMVQTAMIRRGLVNNGYRLTDAHYFTKPPAQRGHKPKHMVCLTFDREATTSADLPEGTTRALRELANTTWQYAHVWSNPDKTATINLVGRQWDDGAGKYRDPENALVVRNHELCAVPVTAHVDEVDE